MRTFLVPSTSPVIPHASACRPNCANGSVATSLTARFATYLPWGIIAVTPAVAAAVLVPGGQAAVTG